MGKTTPPLIVYWEGKEITNLPREILMDVIQFLVDENASLKEKLEKDRAFLMNIIEKK